MIMFTGRIHLQHQNEIRHHNKAAVKACQKLCSTLDRAKSNVLKAKGRHASMDAWILQPTLYPREKKQMAHHVARLFRLTESASFVKTSEGTKTQKISWLMACLALPSSTPCQIKCADQQLRNYTPSISVVTLISCILALQQIA